MRILVCSVLGAALLVSSSGCSGKGKSFKVTGRLTRGNNPLPVPTGGPPAAGAFAKGIQMGFVPFTEDGSRPGDTAKIVFAKVEDDGQYEVPGGLPAGKYLVTVKHTPRGPATEDTLNDAFNLSRSQITVEVAGDTRQDIELDKYKGSGVAP